MDIKIEAVFSLVNGDDGGSTDSANGQPEESMESMETTNDRVVIKEEKIDPGYDNALSWDNQYENEAPVLMEWSVGSDVEDDVKPFQDGNFSPKPFQDGDFLLESIQAGDFLPKTIQDVDSPPSLSMERAPVLRSMLYDSSRELLPPPILVPEVIDVGKELAPSISDPEKANTPSVKCMKIHPSYIVMTKLKNIQEGERQSYRGFKRKHRECPNICKKVHFRRRLYAGKDVFNVKVPSKRYKALLDLDHPFTKKLKKNEKKSNHLKYETIYKGLMEKYAQSLQKGRAERVVRPFLTMPKDFRKESKRSFKVSDYNNMIDGYFNAAKKLVLDETEREITFKRELSKLKEQINFQRSSRKAKKDYRKSEDMPTFLKPVKSSISGRVRKINTKYGEEFIKSKSDEVYLRNMESINKQLIRATNMVEEESKREKAKFQSFINNSDDLFETESNNSSKMQEQRDSDALREAKNARRRERDRQKRLEKAKENLKRKIAEKKDGILIKDIPNELSVFSDMLLSDGVNPYQQNEETDSAHSDEHSDVGFDSLDANSNEQYSRAKSILKMSSGDKVVPKVESGTAKPIYIDARKDGFSQTFDSTMDPARAKALRIPEKVMNLFNRKKTDPSLNLVSVFDTNAQDKVIKSSAQPQNTGQNSKIMPASDLHKFVISHGGPLKPIVRMQAVSTPEKTKTTSSTPTSNTSTSSIGIARQLLKNAVLKSQSTNSNIKSTNSDIKSTLLLSNGQIVAVSGSQGQASKLQMMAPSTKTSMNSPVTVTQGQKVTSTQQTAQVNAPGQNKTETGNLNVAGNDNKVEKVMYYQFVIGGKKYLIPASPGSSMPKTVITAPAQSAGSSQTPPKSTESRVEMPVQSVKIEPGLEQEDLKKSSVADGDTSITQVRIPFTAESGNSNVNLKKPLTVNANNSDLNMTVAQLLYRDIMAQVQDKTPNKTLPRAKPINSTKVEPFYVPAPVVNQSSSVTTMTTNTTNIANSVSQATPGPTISLTHSGANNPVQSLLKYLSGDNIRLLNTDTHELLTVSKPMNIIITPGSATPSVPSAQPASTPSSSLPNQNIPTVISSEQLNPVLIKPSSAQTMLKSPVAPAVNRAPIPQPVVNGAPITHTVVNRAQIPPTVVNRAPIPQTVVNRTPIPPTVVNRAPIPQTILNSALTQQPMKLVWVPNSMVNVPGPTGSTGFVTYNATTTTTSVSNPTTPPVSMVPSSVAYTKGLNENKQVNNVYTGANMVSPPGATKLTSQVLDLMNNKQATHIYPVSNMKSVGANANTSHVLNENKQSVSYLKSVGPNPTISQVLSENKHSAFAYPVPNLTSRGAKTQTPKQTMNTKLPVNPNPNPNPRPTYTKQQLIVVTEGSKVSPVRNLTSHNAKTQTTKQTSTNVPVNQKCIPTVLQQQVIFVNESTNVKPNKVPIPKLSNQEKVDVKISAVPIKDNAARSAAIPDNEEKTKDEKEKTDVKDLPFSELVTAREERLRKLKEALKEKQVAVEKLRQQRMNKDSDGEDK